MDTSQVRPPVVRLIVRAAMEGAGKVSNHVTVNEFISACLTIAQRSIDSAFQLAKTPEQRERVRAVIAEALTNMLARVNKGAS